MRQLLRFLGQLLGLDDAVTGPRFDEAGLPQQSPMEAEQRLDAADLVLVERPEHALARVLAVDPVHDELGHERVVEAGYLEAGLDARVHAHPGACRLAVARDPPGRRQKACRGILGVDPAFDRVAA